MGRWSRGSICENLKAKESGEGVMGVGVYERGSRGMKDL